jgi:hypothetical protein
MKEDVPHGIKTQSIFRSQQTRHKSSSFCSINGRGVSSVESFGIFDVGDDAVVVVVVVELDVVVFSGVLFCSTVCKGAKAIGRDERWAGIAHTFLNNKRNMTNKKKEMKKKDNNKSEKLIY